MRWMPQEQQNVLEQKKYTLCIEEVKKRRRARLEELHHAKEEGIIFKFLNNRLRSRQMKTDGSARWKS